MSGDNQDRLSPADQKIESQLASFAVAAPVIDRDRLMFEAGWQAAMASLERTPQRGLGRYGWPAATALATAASVMLAVMLVREPQQVESVAQTAQREEVETVEVDPSPPAHEAEAPDEPRLVRSPSPLPWPFRNVSLGSDTYLAVRSAVLETGISALRSPEPTMSSSGETIRQPATMRSLMDEYLPSPRADSRPGAESDDEPMGNRITSQEQFS
jgi:hypothetical protein